MEHSKNYPMRKIYGEKCLHLGNKKEKLAERRKQNSRHTNEIEST